MAEAEAYGWELRCTTGSSDKFYRMFAVNSGERCGFAVNYGRIGSAGRWTTGTVGTAELLDKVRTTTNSKIDKGYELYVDFTTINLTGAEAVLLLDDTSDKNPVRDYVRERVVSHLDATEGAFRP